MLSWDRAGYHLMRLDLPREELKTPEGKTVLRIKLEHLNVWPWGYSWMIPAWSPLPVTNCWALFMFKGW